MDNIMKALSSRTVIIVILMIVTNIVSVYGGLLTPEILTLINTVLGALTVYFKLNPSQTY